MKTVLLGFYYGIGDFISALPVIRYLINNTDYNLYVLISYTNFELLPLLNLNYDKIKFIPFELFSLKNIKKNVSLIRHLINIKFDEVVISPHAQNHLTSWKIPCLLKFLKIFKPKAKIVGSDGDRNSFLYDKKIPIDKSLPLMEREIVFYKLAGLIPMCNTVDIYNLFKLTKKKMKNIITIHPGASKKIKMWNVEYYSKLIEKIIKLMPSVKIRFIGLPEELFLLKKNVHFKNVTFVSKKLIEIVDEIMNSRIVITMDSGFSHIVSALGLPHLILFGATNPAFNLPIFQNSHYIMKKKLSCQPCNSHKCKFSHNYCMDLITPDDVVKKLKEMNII